MKINLANPFGSYFVASVAISALYSLGFSDLYPRLSLEMAAFLAVTAGSSLLLTLVYGAITRDAAQAAAGRPGKDKFVFLMICLGFAIEFAYSRSVPLISLALGAVFDYREFGIPTFHVLLVGFNFFYVVRWTSLYLATKQRPYLLMLVGSLVFGLLIINRGAIMISLIAIFFIYIASKLNVRKLAKVGALIVIVVWLFGFIGNLRFLSQEVFQEDPILRIGAASKSFTESGLPNEFFWVYLYATSPLANFQMTVDRTTVSGNYFLQGVVVNFIPDFVSKHIVDVATETLSKPELITPELTVSTGFALPFATMDWLGPYAIYAYFVAYTLGVAAMTKRSQYHQSIMALISAQGALLFFDNMLVFSGAICPVLIGLLLVLGEKISPAAAPCAGHSATEPA